MSAKYPPSLFDRIINFFTTREEVKVIEMPVNPGAFGLLTFGLQCTMAEKHGYKEVFKITSDTHEYFIYIRRTPWYCK